MLKGMKNAYTLILDSTLQVFIITSTQVITGKEMGELNKITKFGEQRKMRFFFNQSPQTIKAHKTS